MGAAGSGVGRCDGPSIDAGGSLLRNEYSRCKQLMANDDSSG